MEITTIIAKDGTKSKFRQLAQDDGLALSEFFNKLSRQTLSLFAPHPLTSEFATELCANLLIQNTPRFVLACGENIIGYFILQAQMSAHEALRYEQQGIVLKAGEDLLFAPCIADLFQNKGFASQVMVMLINHYQSRVRSFVLMGGTQETNFLGRHFYQKHGFKEYGGYQTDIYNIDMRLCFS